RGEGERAVQCAEPRVQVTTGFQREEYRRMLFQPGILLQVPKALVFDGMELQAAEQAWGGRGFGQQEQAVATCITYCCVIAQSLMQAHASPLSAKGHSSIRGEPSRMAA